MSCVEMQNLIQGYSDGELDLINNLRMEEHLKDCPSCERDYENLRTLRSSINRSDLYFNAPADLRRRVHARVHLAQRESLSTVFTIDHDDFETYRVGGRKRLRILPSR